MTADIAALFEAARAAEARAYAPYSRFRVGAAIRAASGAIHVGCNVENAAYPVGACAEAGAISAMVAAGDRQIGAVLVFAAGPEPCTPCGACRQRLREFALAAVPIHVAGPEGLRASYSLGELLPHAFGPDHIA